jgi:hypothetical protein
MKTITFRHGFEYKGQPYGWHEKKLYRLPFASGKRHYGLKQLNIINVGKTLGYCCSRKKLSKYQLEAMTEPINVTVNIFESEVI